jgi:recombination protein RecT
MTSRTEKLRNLIPDAPTETPANGNGVVATRKPDPARDLLASMEDEFAACLPKILPPDLFMRVALTGFRKTPELLACTRKSLLGALLETARLGLEPCTEQAYLIPYREECTLVIGYQGYVQLMYRTGQVDHVEAEMIHEADIWEDSRGDGGRFYHQPAWTADKARPGWDFEQHGRGKPILAYAYARLVGGGRTKVEVCTRERAEYIKTTYAKAAKSPWKTGSFDAMWQKTPVRQVQKWAPKSSELRRALAVDGATFDAAGEAEMDDANVIPGEIVETPPGAPAEPAREVIVVESSGNGARKAAKSQIDRLEALAGEVGMEGEQLLAYLKELTGRDVPGFADLSMREAADVRAAMERFREQQEPPTEGTKP